jgi:hypothetical protein
VTEEDGRSSEHSNESAPSDAEAATRVSAAGLRDTLGTVVSTSRILAELAGVSKTVANLDAFAGFSNARADAIGEWKTMPGFRTPFQTMAGLSTIASASTALADVAGAAKGVANMAGFPHTLADAIGATKGMASLHHLPETMAALSTIGSASTALADVASFPNALADAAGASKAFANVGSLSSALTDAAGASKAFANVGSLSSALTDAMGGWKPMPGLHNLLETMSGLSTISRASNAMVNFDGISKTMASITASARYANDLRAAMPTGDRTDSLLGQVDAYLDHAPGGADELLSDPGLAAVWREAAADLREWLNQPAIKILGSFGMWFALAAWWMNLKVYRPEVADLLEVPLTLLAALIQTLIFMDFGKKNR